MKQEEEEKKSSTRAICNIETAVSWVFAIVVLPFPIPFLSCFLFLSCRGLVILCSSSCPRLVSVFRPSSFFRITGCFSDASLLFHSSSFLASFVFLLFSSQPHLQHAPKLFVAVAKYVGRLRQQIGLELAVLLSEKEIGIQQAITAKTRKLTESMYALAPSSSRLIFSTTYKKKERKNEWKKEQEEEEQKWGKRHSD